MKTVTVLGAGSWGTALSIHLGRIGHDVRLWARDAALVRDMNLRRANAVYLPDVTMPAHVSVTHDLAAALAATHIIVTALPSHGCRAVVRSAVPHMTKGAVIVSATKGLESESLLRMSEVVAQEAGGSHPVVVLSGPSFALEVAHQLPTAVLAASTDSRALEIVQAEFRGPTFRLYGSDDVIGVEIGGAMKNIIAIAAGVVEGLGLGHNALAALITRGLAEVTRLACAAGGRRETLAGLSGLGDLVLTCTGSLSRNRHVGIELARGRPACRRSRRHEDGRRGRSDDRALRWRSASVTASSCRLRRRWARCSPGRTDVRSAIEALMLRRQRAEAETS